MVLQDTRTVSQPSVSSKCSNSLANQYFSLRFFCDRVAIQDLLIPHVFGD